MEMIGFSIPARYPDPYAVMQAFDNPFRVEELSPEIETIQRMLQNAVGEQDDVRQQERYSELQHYIIDNAIALPIRWVTGQVLLYFQPWVQDFEWPKYGRSKLVNV